MTDFTFTREFYNIDFDNFNQNFFNNLQQEVISENFGKGIFDLKNRYKSYLDKSLEISSEIKQKYKNLNHPQQ